MKQSKSGPVYRPLDPGNGPPLGWIVLAMFLMLPLCGGVAWLLHWGGLV